MSTRNVDLEAEQEVDLGRYWSAIVSRWWLPLAGLLVGAVLGYLVSLGGNQVWNASSTVYLGASYSIIGGNLLQGPQANPSTVGTIARAQDSIAQAAAGDVRRTAADTRRIEKELGWRATTELGDGLRAQWEWASVRVAAP